MGRSGEPPPIATLELVNDAVPVDAAAVGPLIRRCRLLRNASLRSKTGGVLAMWAALSIHDSVMFQFRNCAVLRLTAHHIQHRLLPASPQQENSSGARENIGVVCAAQTTIGRLPPHAGSLAPRLDYNGWSSGFSGQGGKHPQIPKRRPSGLEPSLRPGDAGDVAIGSGLGDLFDRPRRAGSARVVREAWAAMVSYFFFFGAGFLTFTASLRAYPRRGPDMSAPYRAATGGREFS